MQTRREDTGGESKCIYLVDDDNVCLEPRVIFTQFHLNIDGTQDLNTNFEEVFGPPSSSCYSSSNLCGILLNPKTVIVGIIQPSAPTVWSIAINAFPAERFDWMFSVHYWAKCADCLNCLWKEFNFHDSILEISRYYQVNCCNFNLNCPFV